MKTKGRFKDATLDQALTLLSKTPRQRRATMATGNMFKAKKPLWAEGEYEKTDSAQDKGYEHKHGRKTPKVSLAEVKFTNRRLDGET
jgi:hypothetical protein